MYWASKYIFILTQWSPGHHDQNVIVSPCISSNIDPRMLRARSKILYLGTYLRKITVEAKEKSLTKP
jgi:radical SAM superfamily enzyme with C-terminal helix-hairpin-helix motif